eukprot:TRINITY_DN50910_c0_g1_i1.p1 TRINITY_DN50910_c0_g1~~TRINITY_DN50910_c0_g1_i1.p1  ORF type:complete len:352 (+),score=74.26 TRINITY_DN50910_c0_g1_i1:89-1057(+)
MPHTSALRTPSSVPPPPQDNRSVSAFSACPQECGEQLRGSVAAIVDAVAEANACFVDDVPACDAPIAYMFSTEIPPFDFATYAKALSRGGRDDAWLAALILADRACKATGLALTARNMHRLLFIGLIVAVKLHVDCRRFSKTMSQCGMLRLYDTCLMERNFLLSVDWRTHITAQEYESVRMRLGSIEGAAFRAAAAADGGRKAHYPLIPDEADLRGSVSQAASDSLRVIRTVETPPADFLSLISPKGSKYSPHAPDGGAPPRARRSVLGASRDSRSSDDSEGRVGAQRRRSRPGSTQSSRERLDSSGSSSALRGSPAVALRR